METKKITNMEESNSRRKFKENKNKCGDLWDKGSAQEERADVHQVL
jgi:hypothetical protein